ncbi:hypothetical protein ACRRTK_006028 [Alexandromys fortis]
MEKATIVSPEAGYATCPRDWIGFGSKCFYFSEHKGNWTSSQTSCMDLKAQLTHFDSLEELTELLMATKGSETPGSYCTTCCRTCHKAVCIAAPVTEVETSGALGTFSKFSSSKSTQVALVSAVQRQTRGMGDVLSKDRTAIPGPAFTLDSKHPSDFFNQPAQLLRRKNRTEVTSSISQPRTPADQLNIPWTPRRPKSAGSSHERPGYAPIPIP